MMSVKLILVCKEGNARQAYLKEAKYLDCTVTVVPSFTELFQELRSAPYQGIMIDLITGMKASREEKGIVQEALEVFPVVQLKWESETDGIHILSSGSSSGSPTLHDFVARQCYDFPARPLRQYSRKPVNFNVTMSKNEVLYEKFLEYTVTINASRGGCFLFSTRQWKTMENVWFIINELQDKTPIVGEVRWFARWGKTMRIPGIGIKFKQITEEQQEELNCKHYIS